MEKQEKLHWMIKIFLKKAHSTKLFILYMGFIVVTACNAQKITAMKKFDIETFNKHKNHLDTYINKLDNGIIIEQNTGGGGYYETIKYKDKYIEDFNSYYKNGNLKIKGYFLENDFYSGIWKEYDEQGNLIKETDYDKGFEYTWEDLVKYLEKRKVDIKDTTNTDIRKEKGNWRFSYVEGIYIYDVIIDGKTGKILQDAKNEFEEGS